MIEDIQKTPNVELEKIDGGYTTWKSTIPIIINRNMDKIDALLGDNPVSTITKIAPYLYDITYTDYDFDSAQKYLKDNYLKLLMTATKESKAFALNRTSGGCSSFRKDNWYVRQYDWYYSNSASFIIHTKAKSGRYASIGVTGGLSEFTVDMVESRAPSKVYGVLPYVTLDGINECGVIASINVVPVGDYGYTRKTSETGTDICVISLPRYILDNYADAASAAADIKNGVLNVWSPSQPDGHAIEIHVMVADKDKTFEIEFIDENGDGVSTVEVLDITDRPIVTNFYLYNTEYNDDNTIKYESVTKYGSGLERYDIIAQNLQYVKNRIDARELAKKVYYTLTYKFPEGEPYKYTEMCGYTNTFGELTVMDAKNNPEKFMPILNYCRALYNLHQRDNTIWQTVHSSVYDIEKRKLYVTVQEQDTEYVFELNNGADSAASKLSGLMFNDLEVEPAAFIEYTPESAVMSEFRYKAEISLGDSVSSGARCLCSFGIADELSGNYVYEKTYSGKFVMYAKAAPVNNVKIDVIIFN